MQFSKSIKIRIKTILGRIFYLVFQKKFFDTKLVVFVYHEVNDNPSLFLKSNGLAISVKDFQDQIKWIQVNFNLINPEILLSSEPLPRRAALITFDDGYRGVFENGLPILKLANIPSIHFLNMEPILNRGYLLSAFAHYLQNYSKNFKSFYQQAQPFFI